MQLCEFLPFWTQLSPEEQRTLESAAVRRAIRRGDAIRGDGEECAGLLLVLSGQLRAFILSGEGREITLYRLLERDVCLLSASCMLRGMSFDLRIEAERDTELLSIPAGVYGALMQRNAAAANFVNEIMAGRFSDVLWLLEQILNQKLDARLAAFLLEEAALEEGDTLRITHEEIARHIGSAREVVTRMLRYFSSEGMVTLSRGEVRLTDLPRLRALAAGGA